ncbi:putative nucleoprotein [Beihai rhabdo-like virus 5]|uniref:Putative nucleoprotein n=1 Tax=Beihai rhabdo-like virus 5 TaxID=1922655 RepID=A0A1L3KMP2_9MONO|nr:putative nucleoprotein [Beihai rhabdo-like virus 5]APG78644.1 putative nucleoprotein [Beihai rhabdo-like virus 5]
MGHDLSHISIFSFQKADLVQDYGNVVKKATGRARTSNMTGNRKTINTVPYIQMPSPLMEQAFVCHKMTLRLGEEEAEWYVPRPAGCSDAEYGSSAHLKLVISWSALEPILEELRGSAEQQKQLAGAAGCTKEVLEILRGFFLISEAEVATLWAHHEAIHGAAMEQGEPEATLGGSPGKKRPRKEKPQASPEQSEEEEATSGPRRKRFRRKGTTKFGRFAAFKAKYEDANHPMYQKKILLEGADREIYQATIYSHPNVAFAEYCYAKATQSRGVEGQKKETRFAMGNFILTCLAAFLPGVLFSNAKFDDRQYGSYQLGPVLKEGSTTEQEQYEWPELTAAASRARYLEILQIGFYAALACVKSVTQENLSFLEKRWNAAISQSDLTSPSKTNDFSFDPANLISFSTNAGDYLSKSDLYFLTSSLLAETDEAETSGSIASCLLKQVEMICEYSGMPRIKLMMNWATRFDSSAHYCHAVVTEIISFLTILQEIQAKVSTAEFPFLRLTRPALLERLSARSFPHLCFCATMDAKMTKNLAVGYAGKDFPMTMSAKRLQTLLRQKIPDVGALSEVQVAALASLGIQVEGDIDEVIQVARKRKRQLVESDSD